MYNVLEKLRSGEALNAKDKTIHEQGLVSVLRELHDALDTAVFDGYGWSDLAAAPAAAPAGKLAWPKNMREQVAAVRSAPARQSLPLEAVAAKFKRSPKAAVLSVIAALEELGMVRREGEAYRLQG